MDSYVYSIQDNHGNDQQGFGVVVGILQDCFKALLGPSTVTRSPINPQVISMGATLNVEQQLRLCSPFTAHDIEQAMFFIPNIKSPGPDGFTSGFFKATWHYTGPLVCDVIQ